MRHYIWWQRLMFQALTRHRLLALGKWHGLTTEKRHDWQSGGRYKRIDAGYRWLDERSRFSLRDTSWRNQKKITQELRLYRTFSIASHDWNSNEIGSTSNHIAGSSKHSTAQCKLIHYLAGQKYAEAAGCIKHDVGIYQHAHFGAPQGCYT